MKFVRTEDLKIGMRLAKPIYNKKGVLLYERDSKLTSQGIESVKNFGLIGIFILEPAEPLPPMSQEDLDFEKFQSVAIFDIVDELRSVAKKGKQIKIAQIAQTIVKAYGHLNHRINFIQTLRSSNDFIYKHSLNVAILCAMLSNKMNLKPLEQEDLIIAALVHSVGFVEREDKNGVIYIPSDFDMALNLEGLGLSLIDKAFLTRPAVKRTASQSLREISDFYDEADLGEHKLTKMAKILIVADEYDRLTAMDSSGVVANSEIAALKHFMAHPELYDRDVVGALIDSINIIVEGCCVELSNGEKALVLAQNKDNILRPMLLSFSSNKILDLSRSSKLNNIEIVDIMKTLDNRHVIDSETLKQYQ